MSLLEKLLNDAACNVIVNVARRLKGDHDEGIIYMSGVLKIPGPDIVTLIHKGQGHPRVVVLAWSDCSTGRRTVGKKPLGEKQRDKSIWTRTRSLFKCHILSREAAFIASEGVRGHGQRGMRVGNFL